MAKLFLEGGPSSGAPAEARPTRLGIEAVADDGLARELPWERASAKLAGFDDAYVAWSGTTEAGEPLEIWTERAFLKQIASYQPSMPPSLRRSLDGMMKKRLAWKTAGLVGLAATASLLLALGWFVFGGGLTDLVVSLLPASVDEAVGEMMAEDLDASFCDDPEVERVLGEMVASLDQVAPEHPYTFEVRVVRSDDVNAVASPGGMILVHSGLLEASSDPSEVAAVLGHEMQHVFERHGLRRIVQAAGVGIAIVVLLGDSGEITTMLAKGASEIGLLSFTRDEERSADAGGFELLVDAGFDPNGAERMFRLLTTQGEVELPEFLSAHPITDERISAAARAAEDLPVPAQPRFHDLDWDTLKTRCGVR